MMRLFPDNVILEGFFERSKKQYLVWYFVTKIVPTYCEKKFVLEIEKNL